MDAQKSRTLREENIDRVQAMLGQKESVLNEPEQFAAFADALYARRGMDLSYLTAEEQFAFLGSKVSHIITPERLKELLTRYETDGTPMKIKYGIDPTGKDVHVGHAVPIILAGYLQRMGHHVIIIVGDVTAKIGDPSGRTKERPPLTDEQIAENLASYREQMEHFIDFNKAELRKNSEWLLNITTPELLQLLARIPLSMQLQREDFRKRLQAGHSLSTAELMYSIYMAYDSFALEADVELGGVDQLLNMQMCRKVMEVEGQVPEVILTTDLIEGTDGTGEKMSKSKGNYIGLAETPEDIYGKIMSIPDRLIPTYFRALTELTAEECELLTSQMQGGALHPMTAKHALAYDLVSILHTPHDAAEARARFDAQFSKRALHELTDIPTLDTASLTLPVLDVLCTLQFAKSKSDARRLAQGGGVQIIVSGGDDQEGRTATKIGAEQLTQPLSEVLSECMPRGSTATDCFIKVGRHVARIGATD